MASYIYIELNTSYIIMYSMQLRGNYKFLGNFEWQILCKDEYLHSISTVCIQAKLMDNHKVVKDPHDKYFRPSI
jgi:hypothetical protein